MVSKLLFCSAFVLATFYIANAAEPCPDGSENEVKCRSFCSDNLCVYSPQIKGFKKIVTQSRQVKIARDDGGSAARFSCVCKKGLFRKSVNGPCVPKCDADETPVNTNVLKAINEAPASPYYPAGAPPPGPYPGFPEMPVVSGPQAPPYPYPYPYPYPPMNVNAAPMQPTEAPEPAIKTELRGTFTHTDDDETLQRDTMLANGMTVEQLATMAHFYRLYNEGTADHFYTYDESQITSAIKDYGYRMESISGKIAKTKADVTGQGITCDRLKALTQFYKGGAGADPDHFYTVKAADAERAVSEGYAEEGVAGYCVDYAPGCGATIPLHRFWSEGAKDHIYITRYKDFNALSSDGAWTYEGVECYIWPTI